MSEAVVERRPRVYPKVESNDVPVIENWVSLPDAAEELGMTRSRAHQMAGEGRFKTLRKLSKNGRPTFMIKRSELAKMIADKTSTETPEEES